MVYVQRDEEGRLLRAAPEPFAGMTEALAPDNPELLDWLQAQETVQARLAALRESDLELVRVLEDVVDALVERGVIRLPTCLKRPSASCMSGRRPACNSVG